jgi:hypothetical protein
MNQSMTNELENLEVRLRKEIDTHFGTPQEVREDCVTSTFDIKVQQRTPSQATSNSVVSLGIASLASIVRNMTQQS